MVGRDRRAIADEVRAAERATTRARVEAATAAASAAERQTAAAGDLEDLGWGEEAEDPPASAPRPPDRAELERLRRDIEARMARVQRTIGDAQQSAARWQKKSEEAAKSGSAQAAREAERNADLERARMHSALAELAELNAEKDALDKAAAQAASTPPPAPPPRPAAAPPPRPARGAGSVDDLLRDLKRQGGNTGPAKPSTTVDDELEALKRKMSTKKRGKP